MNHRILFKIYKYNSELFRSIMHFVQFVLEKSRERNSEF